MKNKTAIIGIASALILGLFLGWLFFSKGETEQSTDHSKHDHAVTESADQIWTCSMHPQIRKDEPGACPICGMDLIPLTENTSSHPYVLEMSDEAVKISQIQTTKVVSENQQNSNLELSGKVEVNESNSASLVTHIPGRIEKLYVSFTGEKVQKGQRIAALYSPLLITAQKELLEAEKMKESQPQLFEATRNKLKYWKITDEQIDEILASNEVKETFNIYAGHSGVVNKRHVSVGDYIGEGEVLFDIQNLNDVWVVFDVYEQDIRDVKVGDVITFSTIADPGISYKSNVAFIDPIINTQTRTTKIRAEISNRTAKLKPEMFVKGQLKGTIDESSDLIVPKSAVMWTGTRSVVYVQLENTKIPSFEYREVVLGPSIGNNYAIKSGLKSGEQVVTHGAFVIDASAQLNNQASMMNRLTDQSADEQGTVPNFIKTTPEAFKAQLNEMNNHYFTVKNALVSGEMKMAKNGAKLLLSQLKKVDMNLVKGDAHLFWMKKSMVIEEQSQRIFDAPNIAIQRKEFRNLSVPIIEVTKAFGIGDSSYEMFCPMTYNKEGGSWLSMEKEVKNPYYGQKMLNCGEVKQQLSF